MKKFILVVENLKKTTVDYVKERIPVGVANDLNTLMREVKNIAQRRMPQRNPNLLEWGDWEVSLNGSHAEILVFIMGKKEGLRFIIDEVEFFI